MKTCLLIATACLAPAALIAAPEPGLRYRVAAGYVVNAFNQKLFSNWGRGWTIGLGVAYPASPRTSLVAAVDYQNLAPTRRYVPWNISDERLAPQPGNTRSHVLDFSLGMRLRLRPGGVGPFISVAGGATVIRFGRLTTHAPEPGLDASEAGVMPGTDRWQLDSSVSLGFGLLIPLTDRLELGVTVGLSSTFQTAAERIPFTMSLHF